MFRKTRSFRAFCKLGAALFLLVALSPLVSFALGSAVSPEPVAAPPRAATRPSVTDNTTQAPRSEPDLPPAPSASAVDAVYIKDDGSLPLAPGMPVYDPLSAADRKNRGLPTALAAIKLFYGEKTVYLTFDDGPDPENTPAILKILRDHGVKGTFFVVGTEVEKYPEILKNIYQEGHAIGNHSYNHVYRELYRSADSYLEQLYRTDLVIKSVIGVRPRISRAPGGAAGSFTKAYWDRLGSEGYIEVGWNVSSGDASSANAEKIYKNIVYQMENKFLWSHAIVLMHDGTGHRETVKALPNIIRFFKERGFEFRVVNLETPPPW